MYSIAKKMPDGIFKIVETLDEIDSEYYDDIDVVKLIVDKYAKRHNIARENLIIIYSDY